MSVSVLVGLVLFFGIGVVVSLGLAFATRSGGAALPHEGAPALSGGVDVLDAGIADLRAGGLAQASGFGDSFEDVALEFEATHRVSVGDLEWRELIASYKGRRVAVECRSGGSDEGVFAVLRYRDLDPADVGLDGSDLSSFEAASPSYEGQSYRLESSGEAFFHKGGEGFGKKLLYWRFGSDTGSFLRAEQRVGEGIVVSFARPAAGSDFQILRVRS